MKSINNAGNKYKFEAIMNRRHEESVKTLGWDIFSVKKNGELYAKPVPHDHLPRNAEEALARLERLNPNNKFVIVYR